MTRRTRGPGSKCCHLPCSDAQRDPAAGRSHIPITSHHLLIISLVKPLWPLPPGNAVQVPLGKSIFLWPFTSLTDGPGVVPGPEIPPAHRDCSRVPSNKYSVKACQVPALCWAPADESVCVYGTRVLHGSQGDQGDRDTGPVLSEGHLGSTWDTVPVSLAHNSPDGEKAQENKEESGEDSMHEDRERAGVPGPCPLSQED